MKRLFQAVPPKASLAQGWAQAEMTAAGLLATPAMLPLEAHQ